MGKKRKNYYLDSSSRSTKKGKFFQHSKLSVGVSGFVVSHDRGKAHLCTKNVFQLLNHYADQFYGEFKSGNSSDKLTEPDTTKELPTDQTDILHDESDDDDIELALAKEVQSLQKSVKSSEKTFFRFYTLKSGCNNMIFMKANDVTPSILLHKIVDDLILTSNDIFATPFILRTHPVDATCKAHLSDIKTLAESYVSKGFNTLWKEVKDKDKLKKEFSIVFRQRNNSHLHKADVQNAIICAIRDSGSDWAVNFKSTKFVLIIEVIQVVCGMGVSYDYFQFKKLNIHELRLSKVKGLASNDLTTSTHVAEVTSDESKIVKKISDTDEVKTINNANEKESDTALNSISTVNCTEVS